VPDGPGEVRGAIHTWRTRHSESAPGVAPDGPLSYFLDGVPIDALTPPPPSFHCPVDFLRKPLAELTVRVRATVQTGIKAVTAAATVGIEAVVTVCSFGSWVKPSATAKIRANVSLSSGIVVSPHLAASARNRESVVAGPLPPVGMAVGCHVSLSGSFARSVTPKALIGAKNVESVIRGPLQPAQALVGAHATAFGPLSFTPSVAVHVGARNIESVVKGPLAPASALVGVQTFVIGPAIQAEAIAAHVSAHQVELLPLGPLPSAGVHVGAAGSTPGPTTTHKLGILASMGGFPAQFVQVTDLGSTANANSYSLVSPATPLLFPIFAVCRTGENSTDWVLSDTSGGTYTKICTAEKNAGADIMEVWMRDGKSSNLGTVTYSHAGAAASGCAIMIHNLLGLSKFGAAAVKQFVVVNDQPGSTTPTTTFATQPLRTNPVWSMYMAAQTSPFTGSPTGFTFADTISYATPATSFKCAGKNTGVSSSTVAWAGANASNYCVLSVEFDNSH
jgi:hypothetical protein